MAGSDFLPAAPDANDVERFRSEAKSRFQVDILVEILVHSVSFWDLSGVLLVWF